MFANISIPYALVKKSFRPILMLATILFSFSLTIFSNTSPTLSTSPSDECQSGGPYGAIGAVYYAYGPKSTQNPLGLPTTGEKRFWGEGDVACGAPQDKYQEFEHGTIYYNYNEGTAFAIFNDLDVEYKNSRGIYGLPISSEIGDAAEGTCIGMFENGYIRCDGTGGLQNGSWSTMSLDDLAEQVYLPEFRMPFDNEHPRIFSSGPHTWNLGGAFSATFSSGLGSGLDIGAGESEFQVLAMASGTVVEISKVSDCTTQDETTLLGCWVAIRHDFSGTVLIYGHIQPTASLTEGNWIEQGMPIGTTTTGQIGNSGGPHVHLELRSGTNNCSSNCPSGDHRDHYGEPLDWHGIIVDDYLLSSGFNSANANTSYNYDGTATNLGNYSTLNVHHKYSQSQLENELSPADYVFKQFWFDDHGYNRQMYAWMTKDAWDRCQRPVGEGGFGGWCENGHSYESTVFANGGLTSTNDKAARFSSVETTQPYLNSSNQYKNLNPRYQPPYPNPPSPTIAPTSTAGNCPTDGRDGIYFYKDQDYEGTCVFSVDDISDFGTTAIGDNALSSIRIIGEWEAQIYEDRNYAGRYDILHNNDANLDENSLGGQYSSVEITEETQTCPTDGREGVYMYSNTHYGGHCLFATSDVPYFGDTIVGNDDLSSIRFIGNWETKIYEDPYYGGLYDVVGSDDPDLDIRSLGSQYSSIEIDSIIVLPTVTPEPSPTPAPTTEILLSPTVNNGGFESGNLDGWQQQGGNFVIDTENPHGGTYYVRGTSAVEATLYRSFSLESYRTQIDQNLGSAYFSTWIDVGKSENYRFAVRFVNESGVDLWNFDTGWSYHAGGYEKIFGDIDTIPAGSSEVFVEVGAKRFSGDFTDVDFDDFNLTLQFGTLPPPTPTYTPTPIPTFPNCGEYTADAVVLFDSAFCNPSAGSLDFPVTGALFNLSDLNWSNRVSSIYIPPGWSVMTLEQSNGEGAKRCLEGSMWDLSIDYFEDGTENMNNAISSLVVYSETGCPDISASPLQYGDNPLVGESWEVSFRITNTSYRDLQLDGVLVGVHGPYCSTWDCTNINDFPWHRNISLQRGESYVYRAKKAFNTVDDRYLMQALTLENDGTWRGHSPVLSFSVLPGIEVLQSVTLAPPTPFAGQTVKAQFIIQNVGTRPITLPWITSITRGPNCTDWNCPDGWADFPVVENLTLQPGEQYIYSQQRAFEKAGNGYFADVAFADANQWWYIAPGNDRTLFLVEPPAGRVYLPMVITP
jgi:murein DD-endopeptidase MepM/ murein hydrolase activator NlpD